jgi:hypothetical protein
MGTAINARIGNGVSAARVATRTGAASARLDDIGAWLQRVRARGGPWQDDAVRVAGLTVLAALAALAALTSGCGGSGGSSTSATAVQAPLRWASCRPG